MLLKNDKDDSLFKQVAISVAGALVVGVVVGVLLLMGMYGVTAALVLWLIYEIMHCAIGRDLELHRSRVDSMYINIAMIIAAILAWVLVLAIGIVHPELGVNLKSISTFLLLDGILFIIIGFWRGLTGRQVTYTYAPMGVARDSFRTFGLGYDAQHYYRPLFHSDYSTDSPSDWSIEKIQEWESTKKARLLIFNWIIFVLGNAVSAYAIALKIF
jgi:hypothetical protein